MPDFFKHFKGFEGAKNLLSQGDNTISPADKQLYKQLAGIKNDKDRADAIIKMLEESNAQDDESTLSMRWTLERPSPFMHVLAQFKDAKYLAQCIETILHHNPKKWPKDRTNKADMWSTEPNFKKLLAKLTKNADAVNAILCVVSSPDSTHWIAQMWSEDDKLYGIISKIEDTQKRADCIIAILNNGNENVLQAWSTKSALQEILADLPQKELLECLGRLIEKGGDQAKLGCQQNATLKQALQNMETNNRSFLRLR